MANMQITNITINGGMMPPPMMHPPMMRHCPGSLWGHGFPSRAMVAGACVGMAAPVLVEGGKALWNGVVKPAWNFANNYVFKPVWNNVLKPTLNFLGWAWDNTLGRVFKWMGNLGKNKEKTEKTA